MMITVVSLHWKRTDNTRLISQTLVKNPNVSEVIVWNNNPDVDTVDCVDGVTVVNSSKDLGLNTRFAAAVLSANDCILTIDDDILPHSETVDALYSAWKQSPEIIHTLHGRKPTATNEYAEDARGGKPFTEAPISLTRCTMYHRKYAATYFEVEPRVREFNHDTKHNGEDILLSYIARAHSGKDVRVYDLPASELPAPHAIHGRAGHRQYRTLLMRRCQKFFDIL
jgi:hypothetical protein